ncbi:MAG: hypothetical protein A2147_07145 [Chloroflexi bacterium RBG_16_57_8]|nr:MAG: hypothetical protein A2147_07145 [Chloroflexi bacterium RBG_16_57_8]
MQIRKTYREVNPDLLFHEIRDFARKQGAIVGETKLETYSQPTDSSSHVTRATLTLKVLDEASKTEKEFCQVHVVGSAKGDTKLMIDVDERLFPQPKLPAFLGDLDFVFGTYEVKGP